MHLSNLVWVRKNTYCKTTLVEIRPHSSLTLKAVRKIHPWQDILDCEKLTFNSRSEILGVYQPNSKWDLKHSSTQHHRSAALPQVEKCMVGTRTSAGMAQKSSEQNSINTERLENKASCNVTVLPSDFWNNSWNPDPTFPPIVCYKMFISVFTTKNKHTFIGEIWFPHFTATEEQIRRWKRNVVEGPKHEVTMGVGREEVETARWAHWLFLLPHGTCQFIHL